MEQGEMTSRCSRSSGIPGRRRHDRLDRVRMRHGDDRLAGVIGHETQHGVHGAHRHLGEGLAAGKPEPAGPALHRGPFLGAVQPGQGLLGPVAHVDLDEARGGPHAQAERPGDGGGGLARALQRRRVDGGRGLGEGGDAPGGRAGLLVPLLREVQSRRPARGASCRWWGSRRGGPAARRWREEPCGRAGPAGVRKRNGRSGTRSSIVGSAPWRPTVARGLGGRGAGGRGGLPALSEAGQLARGGRPHRSGLLRRSGVLGSRRPGPRRSRTQRWCWSAWRPPRTAPTAPGACSPGTGPVTGSSPPSTGRASPRSRPARRGDDGLELDRRLHHRDGALRAAGQQADPGGARGVRAVSRPRAGPAGRGGGRAGAGAGGLAGGGRPLRAPATPGLRPPGREPAARRAGAARFVPPEPAEHVHRQADRAHVRRRVRPGPRVDRFGGGQDTRS